MNNAEKEFYHKLCELLKEYRAELSVTESRYGNTIHVWSYTQWRGVEEIREHIDLDLGSFFDGD